MSKNRSDQIKEAIAQMNAFGSGGSSGERDHSRSTLFWTEKGTAKPKREFKPTIPTKVRQRTSEAPKQNIKVNKAADSQLAREVVLDDSELNDGFDNNMVTQSVQPHKSSLDENNVSESHPAITAEGGVTPAIKQDRGKKLSKETKEVKKKAEERVAEMKNQEEEKKNKEAEKKKNYDARIDFLERSLRLLADRVERLEFQNKSKSDGQPTGDDQPSLTYIIAFPPFKIGKNMKLAPTVRTEFNAPRKAYLDQILLQSDSIGLNPRQYRGNRGQTCGATWPLGNYNDAGEIDEDEARAPIHNEDIVTTVQTVPQMRPKLLQFHGNNRPAYWGTWRKSSNSVGPRRPFGKETIFDYDVDSDDEWEVEVEQVDESSTDSECEAEERNPADHYEVDDVFVVPDGYLSEDEIPDCGPKTAKPSAAQEPFRVLKIKPTVDLKPKNVPVLQRYAFKELCYSLPFKTVSSELNCENGESSMADEAVVSFSSTPKKVVSKELNCEKGESPMADEAVVSFSSTPKKVVYKELNCEKGESSMADGVTRSGNKSSKRLVSDNDVPALIRMLHGTSQKKETIAKDFKLHLEPNRAEESKDGPSNLQILFKITEIASWSKCTEAGAVNGRWCWLVHSDVLACYGLARLSANLNWELCTEMKKRGRKADDSTSEEDNPLAKIPRVSLLKRF